LFGVCNKIEVVNTTKKNSWDAAHREGLSNAVAAPQYEDHLYSEPSEKTSCQGGENIAEDSVNELDDRVGVGTDHSPRSYLAGYMVERNTIRFVTISTIRREGSHLRRPNILLISH
jgi:hypothetical protein